MPIPYSIKNNFIINRRNEVKSLSNILADTFRGNGDEVYDIDDFGFRVKTNNSLLKLSYDFEIILEKQEGQHTLLYILNLESLVHISVFLIFASAFFLFLSVREFLIYGSLISLLFYLVNLFFIQIYIKKNINPFIESNKTSKKEELIMKEKQKKWAEMPYTCEACGEQLTDLDKFCPECGITIKQPNNAHPINLSNYQDTTVRYHYKHK